MTTTARAVHLAERPVGLPTDATWSIQTRDLAPVKDGEVLVKTTHLSIDPAMRGWMREAHVYMSTLAIGDVMHAFGVATVLESRHPSFRPGDTVSGLFGVTDHANVRGDALTPVDLSVAPAPTWLGALGQTGITAWFGLFDVAKAKPGDTVLISGAAGAVGSVAGQLAKAHGCRVIGIAGGQKKTRWLTDELGFDAAIDYKNGDIYEQVRAAAGQGIDCFIDNVGGDALNAALAVLNQGARVAISGAISTYNSTDPIVGPSNYLSLLRKRASMAGFLVLDYEDRYPEAVKGLTALMGEGRLVSHEHVVAGGVDRFPEALLMLYNGLNTGKLVLEM